MTLSEQDGRRTDTAARVAELLDKGMTVLEISQLLKISPAAIYKQIDRHGLTLPTQRVSA